MIARIGCLDRQKSAGPDMQSQCGPADALPSKPLEESGSKVKSGGGRRNGPLGASEDRLIILAVARITAARSPDVGRQRHRAVASERLPKSGRIELEPQGYVTLRVLLADDAEKVFGENEAVAGPQTPRTLCKSAP
jgi:hypothetical protein